ncbi:protein TASOR-like isoform X2 [Corythoichthys intestinalis]|uniref:protein TASOR-like isoform X2 n=1 Tax=Corythoichthys intestinalis TaxID=161448 RepID=UPI0025A65425|nr:protein TASOR-like isoform X2 [Corythoichthys intestinalis]
MDYGVARRFSCPTPRRVSSEYAQSNVSLQDGECAKALHPTPGEALPTRMEFSGDGPGARSSSVVVHQRHMPKEPAKFHIPRKSKEKKELLKTISIESREHEGVMNILTAGYVDTASAGCFTYSCPRLVQSEQLEREFVEKRREMKAESRTEKELEESYCFLLTDEAKVPWLCEKGLIVGQNCKSTLGDPNKGVYLCRYSDLIQAQPLYHGASGQILIFKVMKGRVKSIYENLKNVLDPTPRFDSHLSKNASAVTSVTCFRAFDYTQHYFYEYTFDELRPRPRQVCPYAVVSFHYKGKDSPLPTMPLAPVRQNSWPGEASKEPGKFTVWSGELVHKGVSVFPFSLRSSSLPFLPHKLPERLEMGRLMKQDELVQLVSPTLFSYNVYGSSKEVVTKGLHCSLLEVVNRSRLTGSGICSISTLLQQLEEKRVVLVSKLSERGFVFLLSSAQMATPPERGKNWKRCLQALFVFPESRRLNKSTSSCASSATCHVGGAMAGLKHFIPALHHALIRSQANPASELATGVELQAQEYLVGQKDSKVPTHKMAEYDVKADDAANPCPVPKRHPLNADGFLRTYIHHPARYQLSASHARKMVELHCENWEPTPRKERDGPSGNTRQIQQLMDLVMTCKRNAENEVKREEARSAGNKNPSRKRGMEQKAAERAIKYLKASYRVAEGDRLPAGDGRAATLPGSLAAAIQSVGLPGVSVREDGSELAGRLRKMLTGLKQAARAAPSRSQSCEGPDNGQTEASPFDRLAAKMGLPANRDIDLRKQDELETAGSVSSLEGFSPSGESFHQDPRGKRAYDDDDDDLADIPWRLIPITGLRSDRNSQKDRELPRDPRCQPPPDNASSPEARPLPSPPPSPVLSPPASPERCPSPTPSPEPKPTPSPEPRRMPPPDIRLPPSPTKCPPPDVCLSPSPAKCPPPDVCLPSSPAKCLPLDVRPLPSPAECPPPDVRPLPSPAKCPRPDVRLPPSPAKCPPLDVCLPSSPAKCPSPDVRLPSPAECPSPRSLPVQTREAPPPPCPELENHADQQQIAPPISTCAGELATVPSTVIPTTAEADGKPNGDVSGTQEENPKGKVLYVVDLTMSSEESDGCELTAGPLPPDIDRILDRNLNSFSADMHLILREESIQCGLAEAGLGRPDHPRNPPSPPPLRFSRYVSLFHPCPPVQGYVSSLQEAIGGVLRDSDRASDEPESALASTVSAFVSSIRAGTDEGGSESAEAQRGIAADGQFFDAAPVHPDPTTPSPPSETDPLVLPPPEAINSVLRQLRPEVLSNLCDIIKDVQKSSLVQFYMHAVSPDDQVFRDVKEYLKQQGYAEQDPVSFLKQEVSDNKLLVIIKNKDIPEHIHEIPGLMSLKQHESVVFMGINTLDELKSETHTQLFNSGGCILSEDLILNPDLVTPDQLDAALSLLEQRNSPEIVWRWKVHSKPLKKLKEKARFRRDAAGLLNVILKHHQQKIIEVMPQHHCDNNGQPSPDLDCLIQHQAKHVRFRHTVFLRVHCLDFMQYSKSGIIAASLDEMLRNFDAVLGHRDGKDEPTAAKEPQAAEDPSHFPTFTHKASTPPPDGKENANATAPPDRPLEQSLPLSADGQNFETSMEECETQHSDKDIRLLHMAISHLRAQMQQKQASDSDGKAAAVVETIPDVEAAPPADENHGKDDDADRKEEAGASRESTADDSFSSSSPPRLVVDETARLSESDKEKSPKKNVNKRPRQSPPRARPTFNQHQQRRRGDNHNHYQNHHFHNQQQPQRYANFYSDLHRNPGWAEQQPGRGFSNWHGGYWGWQQGRGRGGGFNGM